MNGTSSPVNLPLCVDLDGTLIRGDLLDEQLVALIKRNPLELVVLAFALLRGKAAFKEVLARKAADRLDVANLPYDDEILGLIRRRRNAGAAIELVSGSHISVVQRVADHLGLFDRVFGTEGSRNLTGMTKAQLLAERHPDGFGYVGDSNRADVPVWAAAEEALVAQVSPGGSPRDTKVENLTVASIRPERRRAGFLRALRIHQWLKNGLVFLPLLLTLSSETRIADFMNCAIGFFAFCLLSSGSYFINDVLDVQADRRHPTKRTRAMASGTVSLRTGFALGLVIMAAGFAMGSLVSNAFVAALAAYTVLTLFYSFILKKLIVLDVLAISILFLLRAYAGATAIDQTITVWLSAFLLFFFLALAIGKRVIELKRVQEDVTNSELGGRAYRSGDSVVLMVAGVGFSIASVMLFLIYGILEQQSLYRDDWAIVLTAGLLAYWTVRFWLLIHRDGVDMDPVAFVIRDPASFMTVAAIAAIALAEQLPRLLGVL